MTGSILMVKILKSFFSYSYIVFETKNHTALIIDPAWDYLNINKNLSDLYLQCILLTHHHFDHVSAAEILAINKNVPVFMAKEEIDYYNFRCKNLNAITNDENLSFGEFIIEPILTPGHTKGSMCYQIENDLFTGDTVFIEGCGICNFDGGNPYEMFESIQKLKNKISKDTIIYPGHSYGQSPGKAFGFLLSDNIYFTFDNCQSFVDFRMRKNQKGLFNFK
jgi:hydroxyacylglutathione hydrolase